MSGTVELEYDGPVAIITNDNPSRHNAFDDDLDERLFDVLAEVADRREVRVVIWRGAGPSFSSGRDVASVRSMRGDRTHHELMCFEHAGARGFLTLDVPIIAAVHGWTIGVSFQRALLCDIRIAATGTRFRLPETAHGVIPDAGGVARLYQMCGPGVVSDLVLTGRTMGADEALAHGIVSRVVARDELDGLARDLAARIVAMPAVTAKLARGIIGHLATPEVLASMDEELIAQTFINRSGELR